MAGAVPTGKIAFLVNTAPLRDEERCRMYYRQLCMATIRLLLFLSSFPRRKPTANLRWCYRLYDSEKACPASKVGLKTESFLELNSASLEAYFSELKAHMGPKQSVTNQTVHSRVLASALGSLVLELPWDKPELRSPTRYSRIGPGQTRKIQQRCKPTDSRDNLVFVMSDCPHSSEDLAAFFYLHAHLPTTQLKGRGNDTKGVFLSEGLSAQLKKCSLSLHWVDTTPLQGKTQMDYDGLRAVSKILQSEEGGILPISSLILPLEGQPLLPNHLKGQLSPFDNLEGQSLSSERSKEQSLSCEKCKGTAVVSMAPNSHCQSLVSASNKWARSPAVSHAVPSSVWLREQLQPGRQSTQMKRRRKDEICERRIGLPLFKPDGLPICFLKGTALTPILPKETQPQSKLTVSRRLPSTKDRTILKEAPLPPQAVQSVTSPEIPVQPSAAGTQSIERQTSCEVPSTASSVAVVLAMLPCHEVPLSWLHRTEAYICGGYHCGKTLSETMDDDSGREPIGGGGSPGVALQDCLHHVKAVTDTVWCLPSEEEEETECGTAQGPHSVSCEAMPPVASVSDGEVLKGSTHSPLTTSPLRELIVVVDRSSLNLESLRTRHDSPPQPLTHEDRCPRPLPSPQVVEVHKREDRAAQIPPSPPLNTVMPDDPPLSGLVGCLDRTNPASGTCEEESTEWGGGRQRIIPTSVGSRTFQGLCLMLSRRQLVAVLGLGGRDELVTYAVLQPITSLRATLAHIRPTKSIKLQELLRREGRPPCRASVRLGCYGDVGGGVATVAASELEIHANLSLLFPRQPQTTSLTENLLQRHIDAVVSSSRANGVAYCLLPWFSLHPHQGISRRALDSCPLPKQPCRSLSRSRALCALKRAYGCRSVGGADDCSVRGTDTAPHSTAGDDVDRQTDSEVIDRGGTEKSSSPQLLAEATEQESVHPPLAEASAAFTNVVAEPSTYECSCVEEVVTRFREAYSQLLSDKTEPGTLHKMIHKHFSWLWRQLDNLGENLSSFLVAHVLQSCSSLKEKYTSLTGSPRRVSTDPLLPRELFLQIMLYLEAISAGVMEGLDPTSQIVSMCIALLPFSDMCPVGKLFQDVVLPSYAATCQEVLTNVYDELMWPLPPTLGGDDVSISFLEAKTPATSEDTDQSHDSHMTNLSPLEEYRAPRAPASTGSVKSVVLARQHSFHCGTAANKEIALLATGKGRRKRKTGSRKVKPQMSPGVTSSKLSAKLSADDGESNINKVKRSLFTRSYSTSERVGMTSAASSPNSKARKRTRSDENDLGSTPKRRRFQPNSTIALGISCVKETPVKKQVANPLKLKLQRARSKVNVSPDVLSVAETPKRSRLFYTQLPKGALPEGGGHIVKKDPSPESVKALLHGRLALRGKKTVQPPQSADPHVEQLITDIIEESPSKNSSLDQSLSEDPMVVISCTPLRTSRPKLALLLDTPLKIGAVMQRSANVGCNSDEMTGRTSLSGGTTPKNEPVLGGSVNAFEQAAPSASGRSDGVTPVATGYTTPVRRPPAEGVGWSVLLHGHTNSPDLFISSPCSGPRLLYNTPTTCTDGSSPTPSPTPIIPSYHWPSPQSVHSQREVPVSIETDSHMAFLMSTPPKSRKGLPLSFQGIFPKAE